MAKIIDFSEYADFDPDIDELDREGLLQLLEDVRGRIAKLDRLEPRSFNSESYEQWGELHERLEDVEDDILDRLDELE